MLLLFVVVHRTPRVVYKKHSRYTAGVLPFFYAMRHYIGRYQFGYSETKKSEYRYWIILLPIVMMFCCSLKISSALHGTTIVAAISTT